MCNTAHLPPSLYADQPNVPTNPDSPPTVSQQLSGLSTRQSRDSSPTDVRQTRQQGLKKRLLALQRVFISMLSIFIYDHLVQLSSLFAGRHVHTPKYPSHTTVTDFTQHGSCGALFRQRALQQHIHSHSSIAFTHDIQAPSVDHVVPPGKRGGVRLNPRANDDKCMWVG